MTTKELRRISNDAMLAARAAHASNLDTRQPSDFGRMARAWERLADAAEALSAMLDRDSRSSLGVPSAMQPVYEQSQG